jgi:hypothetical protein
MIRKALIDHKYEAIKAHLLEPLSDEHQEIMDRVISMNHGLEFHILGLKSCKSSKRLQH